MPANQPIVLLKELEGTRYVPIWIGAVEATAIAFAQEGVTPPRPLTHDLFRDTLQTLEATLEQVRVLSLQDGVFLAELVLSTAAGASVTVSARPSDAIALALRTQSTIAVADEVLDEVGIEAGEPDEDSDAEEELEQFREFLDHVSPEDFEQ